MKRNALVLATVMGVLTAASAVVVTTTAYSQTNGMDRRDDRQDDRGDARDEKQACKAGDEKSRPECRQDKRDTKQDDRHDGGDDKPEAPKSQGG